MDSLIKQTRRRHPTSQGKTGEVGSSTREKKVPPRNTVSFKEDKKKPSSWLERQFSRQMSDQSYDSISDKDHAAAVAATAYAITTFEETWLESYHSGLERGASLSTSKSRREDASPFEEPRRLSRRFSRQLSFKEPELNGDQTRRSEDSREKHERQRKPVSEPSVPVWKQQPVRTRSERRAKPPPPPPPPLPSPSPLRLPPREMKRQSSGRTSRKDDSIADAWEKAELAKIKARYEKLNRKIDLWEAKKRDKARRKLDKSESGIEQKRRRGLQRFREDTEYIEQIASGARAQAERQKQTEEFKVKEKAEIVRNTGKLPGKTCLCF